MRMSEEGMAGEVVVSMWGWTWKPGPAALWWVIKAAAGSAVRSCEDDERELSCRCGDGNG